ncbi:hypothetical protein [Candidatus Orientia mediorientalis]|uniref:hypothetical protein n=1 Tax=Candidatus Orientia mediorientalis TaxID=911112 RepID=UPI000A9BD8B5|nr:hypothetical protein [Candidatus Orientia mediorientalis]
MPEAIENFDLAIKNDSKYCYRIRQNVKKINELENFIAAKEYEQKLQMLKKYS